MATISHKIGKSLLAGFYVFAGANHFINPDFYIPLIPPYFKFLEALNYFSGLLEISFGTMILFKKTQNIGVYGIIFLLLAFIPSHVYFIQAGSCIEEALCVPEWAGWARLVIVHPILIYWAWSHRKRRIRYE